MVVLDSGLQKEEAGNLRIPRHQPPQITGIDAGTAREIARSLLDAQNPRINVGRLRTPDGVKSAVMLAELVGASTSTQAAQGPMSFPDRHPLCGPGASGSYDFTLNLEQAGGNIALLGPGLQTLLARDVAKIGFGGIAPDGSGAAPATRGGRGRGGALQTRTIEVDPEASLPAIIDEVRRQTSPDKQRLIQERTR